MTFALPFPAIDPILIEIGPIAIRWYGLAYVAGLILAWRYVRKLAGGPPEVATARDVDDFLVWATLGVILGGRLGYVIFYQPDYFLAHPLAIFKTWNGGMSFHGGLLGVIVATLWFVKRRKIPLFAFGDIIACAAPIGLFFGRLANFINGELFGRPTDLPWGIVFPNGGPQTAPSEPAVRSRPGGASAVYGAVPAVAGRQHQTAARHPVRRVPDRLFPVTHAGRTGAPAGRPDRLPARRFDHGPVAVISDAGDRDRADPAGPPAKVMTPLEAELLDRIALNGPMTLAEFMAEALTHPRHGYYATRDPLGVAGDFITAPEVSQMFGELIGLWCAVVWQGMGAPDPFVLAELGPGRGTLMADALRAARRVPGFRDAARVHLVETNPVLRERQAQSLADAGLRGAPAWHDDFAALPDGPMLLIANEFFDALPVRQFERGESGWHERLVAASADGTALCLALGPAGSLPSLVPKGLADAAPGKTVEICPGGIALAHALGSRLAEQRGAALIIDYGYAPSQPADTVQAVRGHAYCGILEQPGETDLTAHVDFDALAGAAGEGGARVFGPLGQGAFLERLGLKPRSEMLLAGATPDQAAAIKAAYERLTAADQMGELFKAFALQHPDLAPPPAFD